MIVKPLEISKLILQTEALARRLPLTHPQKATVDNKARNLRAGFKGELSLEFPLSFLPNHEYLIFYHLRIRDPNDFFQIDTLIVSAKFMLIIEVKNIKDHVIFDDMGQAVRIEADKEQAFINPVNQVKLQHLRLLHWLRQFNLPPIPIEKIVVYSNPNTILKNLTNDKTITEVVMHKEKILDKIDEFSSKYNNTLLNEEQLMDISFQLLSAHVPEEEDVLKKYRVSSEELIKGVFCPVCSASPMMRKGGSWKCRFCNTVSKTAHKDALGDYALLISYYINNRQARDFLQLESNSIARKLLQKGNLEKFGTTSGVKYKLNIECLIKQDYSY